MAYLKDESQHEIDTERLEGTLEEYEYMLQDAAEEDVRDIRNSLNDQRKLRRKLKSLAQFGARLNQDMNRLLGHGETLDHQSEPHVKIPFDDTGGHQRLYVLNEADDFKHPKGYWSGPAIVSVSETMMSETEHTWVDDDSFWTWINKWMRHGTAFSSIEKRDVVLLKGELRYLRDTLEFGVEEDDQENIEMHTERAKELMEKLTKVISALETREKEDEEKETE